MTTFDKRENAAEAAFTARESAEFEVRARRDRLVGHWAAELLGLQGDDAKAYAKSLVATDLEKHGEVDVIAKLTQDFKAKGVEVSATLITNTMAQKLADAREQLKAGQK
ncbi:MAG: DUF1476 domain-containing protein [Aestuariivirga sp.]